MTDDKDRVRFTTTVSTPRTYAEANPLPLPTPTELELLRQKARACDYYIRWVVRGSKDDRLLFDAQIDHVRRLERSTSGSL